MMIMNFRQEGRTMRGRPRLRSRNVSESIEKKGRRK